MSVSLRLGVVDVKSMYLETAEDVAERIRLTLEHVNPEKLYLTCDCGFFCVVPEFSPSQAGSPGGRSPACPTVRESVERKSSKRFVPSFPASPAWG